MKLEPYEVGDHEVVQTHRERHQSAGNNAGHDLVNDDLRERLKRRAAEIQRRLFEVWIHLLELRHDVENHVGET